MRLNRRETLAGVSMRNARDFLRAINEGEQFDVTIARACRRFGKGVGALGFVNELVARGWIERHQDEKADSIEPICRLTALGRSVAAAKMIAPIPRAKAQSILADFLQR